MGQIYLATNMINNKVYIGLTTKTLKWRIGRHHYQANRDKTSKEYFLRALKKYGESVFNWITLIDIPNATKEELAVKEIEVIALFKNNGYTLYNETNGGEGTVGYRHTEEVKEKMRKLGIGRYLTQETRDKISATKKGKVSNRKGVSLSDSTKDKISLGLMGKTQSMETRLKRSKSMKETLKNKQW